MIPGMAWSLAAGYVLVAFMAFVVASTLGIGGPLLLIPALMLTLPPAKAVAVLAPIMLVNSLVKLWVFRAEIEWRPALRMAAVAVPVAFVASFFTGAVEGRTLQIAIALLILAAVAAPHILRRELRVSDRGLFGWGATTGLAAGLTGLGGPPVALGLRGYGLERAHFVGTAALVQAGLQLGRMPGYIETGLLDLELGLLAAVLGAAAALSVPLGRMLLERMAVATFRRLLDALLLIVAAWLLIRLAVL